MSAERPAANDDPFREALLANVERGWMEIVYDEDGNEKFVMTEAGAREVREWGDDDA